jgi:hypothetical protein
MGLFVHCFTDVISGESCKNQSLNGTGKEAKEHGRKWNKDWNQEGQNCHNQFVGQDISE